MGVVSTIYTTIGGYGAVIWSDAYQAVIIIVSLILVASLGTNAVGSIGNTWIIFHDERQLSWSVSPTQRSSTWTVVLSQFVIYVYFIGNSQMGVQRIASLPSLASAKLCVLCAIVTVNLVIFLSCTTGVITFSYFTLHGCDPFTAGKINNKNKILLYFIKEVINYPGLPGIFTAGLACGTLSNLSSLYNSCSALIWEDILKEKLEKKNLSDKKKTLIIQFIACCAGVITTSAGFLVANMKGTLLQTGLTLHGVVSAPMVVCIGAGALTPKTSWKSIVIGSFISVALISWIGFGSSKLEKNPVISGGVTNCTTDEALLKTLQNTTEFYSSEITSYSVSSTDSMPLVNITTAFDHEHSDDVFILYKLSFNLLLPLSVITGLILTLIFSFIPGLRNVQPVEPRLLFPCMRTLDKCNTNGEKAVDIKLSLESQSIVNSDNDNNLSI